MPSGEYEFIRNKEDFLNLVEKYMGEESLEYLKELISTQIEILEDFEEKLEDCESCIDDLKNEIAEIKNSGG